MTNSRWLYLAQIGTEVFKIGVSIYVDERMGSLARANPGRVRLCRKWRLNDRAYLVESLAKGLLCNAGLRSPDHPRSREYFVADPKQMLAAIQGARYLAAGECPRLMCDLLYRLTRPVGKFGSTWYWSPKMKHALALKQRAA